jgi:hypothetical protein
MFIGFVLLVAAGLGLWWSGLLVPYLPQKTAEVQQQATTTPQAAAQPVSDLPTGQSDTSDAAIAQDTAALDVQMQALSGDEASADQSLDDKSTPQEF